MTTRTVTVRTTSPAQSWDTGTPRLAGITLPCEPWEVPNPRIQALPKPHQYAAINALRQRIIAALTEPMTAAELARSMGMKSDSVSSVLFNMHKLGMVARQQVKVGTSLRWKYGVAE